MSRRVVVGVVSRRVVVGVVSRRVVVGVVSRRVVVGVVSRRVVVGVVSRRVVVGVVSRRVVVEVESNEFVNARTDLAGREFIVDFSRVRAVCALLVTGAVECFFIPLTSVFALFPIAAHAGLTVPPGECKGLESCVVSWNQSFVAKQLITDFQ